MESGCHSILSCLHPEGSASCKCSLTQKMKKGWKHRDYLQRRARQEHLNYSRNWRVDEHSDNMIVKMGEEYHSCTSTLSEEGQFELQFNDEEEKLMRNHAVDKVSHSVDGVISVSSEDNGLISPDCNCNLKNGLHNVSYGDESSCTTDCSSSNKESIHENASVSNYHLPDHQNELALPDDNSSDAVKFIVKSKRHCDRDLDNPKPSKFRRPVDDCSFLSCKYSAESFCSIDDHLPDGFYDAGRDRPFMTLEEYEQSLCLDSREVILLDR